MKTPSSWVLIVLTPVAVAHAQTGPKSIALTHNSNVPTANILKSFQKRCPNVAVVSDAIKSDYTLEAIKTVTRPGLKLERVDNFDLTLLDRDGTIVRSASTGSLTDGMKDLCRAVEKSIPFEVVDTNNLTLSSDVRGDTSHGLGGALATSLTGRRTHTDAMTMYAIVKGEHALLDCYEHRTGCATIAPGKYYGELEGNSIWVDYRMPVTHKPVRNHYKIAGSW